MSTETQTNQASQNQNNQQQESDDIHSNHNQRAEYLELIEFNNFRTGQQHHKQEKAITVAARRQLEASTALAQAQAAKHGAKEESMKEAAEDDMGDDIKWHCTEHHHHYPSQNPTPANPQNPPANQTNSLLKQIAPWLIAGALGAGGATAYNYFMGPDLDVSGALGASDDPPKE